MSPSSPPLSRAVGAPDLTPVALAGPTASGKSAAALAVARALASAVKVEIVSVDSALVYRDMDIGTAKPTPAEQAEVPHHGIDLIEPTGRYSAAQFVADARRWVGEIQSRGALPLLVGGTMLYLKALREGLDAMPAADATLRAQIDARAAAEGWPALHAALARVDPVTAARLKPMDAQRIQRALEVWHLTGRPLSAFHAGAAAPDGASPTGGASATDGLRLRLIALEPRSRAWLYFRLFPCAIRRAGATRTAKRSSRPRTFFHASQKSPARRGGGRARFFTPPGFCGKSRRDLRFAEHPARLRPAQRPQCERR